MSSLLVNRLLDPETPPDDADVAKLTIATADDLDAILKSIVDLSDAWPPDDRWRGIFVAILARQRQSTPPLTDALRFRISELYSARGEACLFRHLLLAVLTQSGGNDDLRRFAELVANDPPSDGVVVGFAPLLQRSNYDPTALFPDLFAAVQYTEIAGCVFDLANFLTREGRVARHPAADRIEEWLQLLSELTQSLGALEEAAQSDGADPTFNDPVSTSVSLAVSLCDALALIGDRRAIEPLNRVLELGHRRLQTEAAAALTRLGDKRGAARLAQLAEEPVARLRVLEYARELDIEDQVDDQYRTPVARAEAELALWLSQPSQFGMPPLQLDRVDQREMYWPGHDEPVECFLLRYHYPIGTNGFHNIGIAGPSAQTVVADIEDMPPDDIYALFAGLHCEHPEITSAAIDQLDEPGQAAVQRIRSQAATAGYENLNPLELVSFFGSTVLVSEAERSGVQGTLLVDDEQTYWLARKGPRPLGPKEAVALYQGRKLLAAFNA